MTLSTAARKIGDAHRQLCEIDWLGQMETRGYCASSRAIRKRRAEQQKRLGRAKISIEPQVVQRLYAAWKANDLDAAGKPSARSDLAKPPRA